MPSKDKRCDVPQSGCSEQQLVSVAHEQQRLAAACWLHVQAAGCEDQLLEALKVVL
jgi:hypothetical protein